MHVRCVCKHICAPEYVSVVLLSMLVSKYVNWGVRYGKLVRCQL